MLKLRVGGGLALLAIGATLPAAAQDASIGFDVGLNSNYNWRGLSLTNKPVIQPDAWLSAYGLTGGFWFNVEPTKYDGPNDLSESGGVRSGIAEIDPWIEYARSFANVDAKVGWVAYWYNKNNGGIDNTSNTSEIYAQVSLSNLPVTPTLAAWYDIDKVKGLYVQGQLVYGMKVTPAFTLNLGALAGLSAGQEVSANDPSANFANSGLTHIDLSANTSVSAGSLSIVPSVHFQISHDDFTRFNNAQDVADFFNNGTKGPGTKFWFGVTLSWSQGLGASKSE